MKYQIVIDDSITLKEAFKQLSKQSGVKHLDPKKVTISLREGGMCGPCVVISYEDNRSSGYDEWGDEIW